MTTTIQKWGNSCAVRLPRQILDKLDLKAGHEVEIDDDGKGTLRITRVPRNIPSLASLVSHITKDNQHDLVDWGPAVGKEIW